MNLILKAVFGVLTRKATKSLTSYIGGAVAASGVATAINPDLIGLIPEQYRPTVLMVVGVAVIAARHRKDLAETYGRLKAEWKAAVAAAEKGE